jgi:hypothetical protein
MAEALARRVAAGEPSVGVEAVDRQVARLYLRVFQREPTLRERDRAGRLVREHGLSTLARVLFNSNEFVTIE